jgi:hypothetical protein
MVVRDYLVRFANKIIGAWTYEMPDGKLEQFQLAVTTKMGKFSKDFFCRGKPSRPRTCDPTVKSAFEPITTSHGFYDSLTVTEVCSRFGVHLVTTIPACLPVFHPQM